VTAHPIHEVRHVAVLRDYVLRVRFEDATEQVIDLEPVLEGELFAPLRDPALFRAVAIDPHARTLVWQNGADFDPARLHDWPEHAEAFARRAADWRRARAALP
jgi:hypothetical protein